MRNTSEAVESADDSSPPTTNSDPVSGLYPSVPKDFQIFINLVDLCKSLFPCVQPSLFSQWVPTFGREMIVHSTAHPLISGFYKLLGVALKMCSTLNYFQDIPDQETDGDIAMETDSKGDDRRDCFILFRKFVREVLVRMKQYKEELLVSCLQLLLSLPKEIVQLEISSLVPALQTTFKLGLSYLPLASTGLSALEKWAGQLSPSLLHPPLRAVLPYLDEYLKTNANSTECDSGSSTVVVQSGSTRAQRHKSVKVIAKWKEGIDGAESPNNKVRRRIVHFLGTLGGQVNSSLVENESAAAFASHAVAWDSQNRLEFPLPFQDMKPSIYFDPFLPRVCELATTSSDRQTKVAACELLHALVLYMIGKSAQPVAQSKSPMTKLFRKVFPFLLQLACDVEKVTGQLFRPLIFQMIHWFTRNRQYESPDTIALLDALLDGIVHPSNTSLRDFAALCVREFLVWSIKQTSKKQQEKSALNTKSLLKRLYSLASHPSATKRLGAALAINSIYAVFREESTLVDTFVLEMMVVMINSLRLAHKDDKSLGTQEQTCQAIRHLTRIIRAKATALNVPSKTRRAPKGVKEPILATVVLWVLTQCGSPETSCREQCIQLFTKLASLLPKTPTGRVWVRRTVEGEGGHFFVTRFEKGGLGSGGIQRQPVLSCDVFSLSETVSWFESLNAALDCYTWVLEEQLLSPGELFSAQPKKPLDKSSCLFESLHFFLSSLSPHGLESAACVIQPGATHVFMPSEGETYNRAKCGVGVRVLKFTAALLKHPTELKTCVPDSFWSDDLYQLVCLACLRPTALGFSSGDVASLGQLPSQVKLTLEALASSPADIHSKFVAQLSLQLAPGSFCDLIGQMPLYLHDNSESEKRDHNHLDYLIQGHISLQTAGLLLSTLEIKESKLSTVCDGLLESVLGSLKPLLLGHTPDSAPSEARTLSPANETSVGLLLELALITGVTPSAFVDCLLDKDRDVPGLGFLLHQTFPPTLHTHLLTHHTTLLPLLAKHSQQHQKTVSSVLSGLLEHVSRDKSSVRSHVSSVSSCLLSVWPLLARWCEGGPSGKLAAVSLLKKMLAVDPKVLHTAVSIGTAEPVVAMYTALIEDANSPLSFKSKVLEILHYFVALPADYRQRLVKSIRVMVANQFPLKSTEFVRGSPQCNEYVSVMDKFLNGLVVSGSVELLEVLINVMCRDTEHVHEERIQSSLVNLVKALSSSDATEAITVAYKVFRNEGGYPPEARRGACERVCLPLLRVASEVTLREFFLGYVGEVMGVVEATLSRSDTESYLTTKLCCFQLLEVLYSRLPGGALTSPGGSINNAYCKGSAKSGKELTQAITKAGHLAKSEDLHGDRALYELRRQYHCMAYNLLVAVITCTQSKIQFYTGFLFKEEPLKGQFLWDNLIDKDKPYHFEIELESRVYRKRQVIAIRDEVHSQREDSPFDSPPFSPHYLSSQYLADSSLSTDISQFDFSTGPTAVPRVSISSTPEVKETAAMVVMEEQLEQDCVNTHECMVPLMRLLDHMEHNKINPEIVKGSPPMDMPSWMVCLHKKLHDNKTQQNVKIFIAKLIVNRPTIFQPYAKFWLSGLTELVVSGHCGGAGLHSCVVDVVVTMLSWAATAVLESCSLANRLLGFLMQHAYHDTRAVFRNNLEIIKTLVESWRSSLQTPTRLVYSLFTLGGPEAEANSTGVQLLGILVANKMPAFEPATAVSIEEKKFFMSFVNLLGSKPKAVYGAAAEVVGMAMAQMEETNNFSLPDLQDVVVEQLTRLVADRNEQNFLTCLHKIQTAYSKITDRFVEKLLFLLPNFHGVFRSMCLEILCPQADLRPRLYLELRDKGFHSMLTHRDEPTQLAALEIIKRLSQHHHLDTEHTAAIVPMVTGFGTHSSESCRQLMYEILIILYSNLKGEDSPDEVTLTSVKGQLLEGLGDDAESIRLKMYTFWNASTRLSGDTLPRLTQLLPVLYSTGTERQFLYNSTNLLLELTSRSPDFNRSVFDDPLSECKFEEYRGLDISWQQRHLTLTPMFAATLASSPGGTLQTEQSLGGSLGLRATQQSLAFTPTQEADCGGYNWMAPSLQSQDVSFSIGTSTPSTADSALLTMRPPSGRPFRPVGDSFGKKRLGTMDSQATDPEEQKRLEVLKLKRRFIRDKSATSAYIAKIEAKRKIARQETVRRQKASRDSRVVMYRQYRVGELPDIQIKHSELIRPFQALAQHDSRLARMLFAQLFKSIFSEGERTLEEEAKGTTAAVRNGLNAVMETSTLYYPPFIGSLQDVCFRQRSLDLDPAVVSRACLMSTQEPIGIMLLEKQLLNSADSAVTPRPSKRSRGENAPLPEGTIAWVEVARLYKSLGDFDSLRGIFSSQVGTRPITKEAMDAEERGDYLEAVERYKEAIGHNWGEGGPLQAEEDLWDDSLLQCYSHLTEWTELEAAALVNVDESTPPKLDKLWDDNYFTEHYLPHLIRAKVKLACSGKDDPNFASFLTNSLRDAKKKALLESEHSMELALYSILQDNHDGARYYTGLCLQAFLHDWSNIDQLLVKSRTSRLHGLQILAEMNEYLQLITCTSDLESHVTGLLQKWAGRYPHPKLDPIRVWDDIVTGRCLMMTKLLERLHFLAPANTSAEDSMEVDGSEGSLSVLTTQFSREFTQLYLKMADSARQQSNYAVATRYLKLTEKAVKEHFPGDTGLKLHWLHSVARMKLQQAEQDPSPKKIEPIIGLIERLQESNSDTVTLGNHTLSRQHHLLEGVACDQLSQAFREEGLLLMDVLSDDRMAHLRDIMGVARTETLTPDQVSHKLLLRALASLKNGVRSGTADHKASGEGEGMVSALLEMAAFCDRQLRLKEDDEIDSSLDTESFPSVVVAYSLKAMKFGSPLATQRFPRLLQLVELYPATMETFQKKSRDVPDWMFIGWISQMVALLNKAEGPAVHETLLSIATNYPQALIYHFKTSSSAFETHPPGETNQDTVDKLRAKLTNKLVDGVVSALELLCSPELVFKDYCDYDLKPLMEASVEKRNISMVKKVWRGLRAQLQEWEVGSSGSLYGGGSSDGGSPSIEVGSRQKRFAKDYIRKLDDACGEDGRKLCSMKAASFNSVVGKLFEQMKPGLNKIKGAGLLKEYSPWLAGFQGNHYHEHVEIPGQYDGSSKPLPEYHVKISGFDEKVLVMSSMRKPKRVTIRGDNEREYMFLVKGGEDLRQDQRIEQLFGVMNEVLSEDAACSQRGIRLRTYQVVPMTPRVGVIEWMQNTKPLKDFLVDNLTDAEKGRFTDAFKYQSDWLKKYGGNSKAPTDVYKAMYKKASKADVEKEFRRKVACLPWDLLRRSFMSLATTPEAFLTLRYHFLRTWASVSMCQYVLGIGDRHLSNYMVDMESGGVIGIDFGHAFGTATQFLPIPELIPFRLTPQVMNLLLPHKGHGLLRSCMVHTLRALRHSSAPLLNTMDVFVKEPHLEWQSFARKQAKTQKKAHELSDSGDSSWYPKEKIRQARKKLQGYNPAHVMLFDLTKGHERSPEFTALKTMLMGEKKYNERAKCDERCNSVEQQVLCLMDHASDPNILGRTWQGWEPWV
ncbi:DNA-dependent protein kinase catalytic subunit-like isoform X2 [Halichondria panicea]|uniref:DNA-dependent protein kinase catalytic subunit-like isoform X2 n=1 Tax=Halichondria panicea TaxID=6063 RepID=UPI00312B5A04